MTALPIPMDSPIRAIEAVLDEVEGLRRTDAASHLPAWMVQRLRELVLTGNPSAQVQVSGGNYLTDLTGLVGRTVSHVWDTGLVRGEAVILCSDGAYLALDIEDGGEDAYLTTCSHYGSDKGLAAFLGVRELREAGLLDAQAMAKIEREEAERRLAAATRQLNAAALQVKQAQERLDKLPKPQTEEKPA